MARTTRMSTSLTARRMPIRTSLAAITLAVLLNRRTQIHNTQTRFTRTLHLSYSHHGWSLQGILVIIEQLFMLLD